MGATTLLSLNRLPPVHGPPARHVTSCPAPHRCEPGQAALSGGSNACAKCVSFELHRRSTDPRDQSPRPQDFYNLCDVYMDAVFHPRCLADPAVFQQEGWHFELDGPEAEMSLKGVVFNEMKGVYSQPDSLHYEAVQARLSSLPCFLACA
jgi:hypothetical protein